MRTSPVLFAIVAAAVGAVYGCSLPLDGLPVSANSGGAGGAGGARSAASAGGALATATGTTTSANGGGTASSTSTGGTACTTKDQCPSDNPCITYECAMNLCVPSSQKDGTEVLLVAGDCKKTVCMGGAPMSIPDLTDAGQDSNPCTSDTCDANGPVHAPGNDGDACGSSGHHCFAGQCLDCATPDQCPQGTNPCKPATCFGGACGFADDPDGVSCANSTECKSQGVCSGGTCSQKDKNDGTPCGLGAGKCASGDCCFGSVCSGKCCGTGNYGGCNGAHKCNF
jgi:hypothetical protein